MCDESEILRIVAEFFDVSVGRLKGVLRTRYLSRARMVAMVLLRLKGLSYPEIGFVLGRRHHTTIMHGCLVVAADPELLKIAMNLAREAGVLWFRTEGKEDANR